MVRSVFYPARGITKLLLSAALLVAIAIMTVFLRSWRTTSATLEINPPAATQPQSALTTQPVSNSPSQLEVERVTVTSNGFDPVEIKRSSGQIMLAIDNRSGLDEVRLRLEREGDKRLIDVRVGRENLDWRQRVTFSPGRYRLTEANHLDWLCVITITE